MMSLNDVLLDVLLLIVIGPILFATAILYSTRKDKTRKKQWQTLRGISTGALGATIGLLIGHLLVGDGLSYTFSKAFSNFQFVFTIFPITWLILMYMEKRRMSQKL